MDLKNRFGYRSLQIMIVLSGLLSTTGVTAGVLSDRNSADGQPAPAATVDTGAFQIRSVNGLIIRARTVGNAGPAVPGIPLCTDLVVGIYLQNTVATRARLLASVVPVDTSTVTANGTSACAFSFSTEQVFPDSTQFRRWFTVVNERGPIDYRNSCYQQAYADLGTFAAGTQRRADIVLVETCSVSRN